MGKSKTHREGSDPFPPLPSAVAEPSNDLPGNLPPLSDGGGDPAQVPPMYSEEDMPPPDEMQALVDQYTPPFQPAAVPNPPSQHPQSRPTRALTKPYGAMMSSYLYARSRKPPANVDQRFAGGSNSLPSGAVLTSQPAALRQALSLIGLSSDRNPAGLSISPDTAKFILFGKKDLGDVDEASFRASMENGDISVDKSKIRQFVNYDGSITYEILNDDKSIMSRFTLGDFKGKKVFVQGGYAAYAQSLRDLTGKFKQIQSGVSEFDKLRTKLSGGG
jgi:hypothetical protein